jgi:hypothetical protein
MRYLYYNPLSITGGAPRTDALGKTLYNRTLELGRSEEVALKRLGYFEQARKEKRIITFEETLNRAAEEATKKALPIFIDAIKNMSVSDGFSILKGGDGAATKFLKSQTSNQLVIAFSPVVKEATTKVQLTAYWNPIITRYNSAMTLSSGQKLDPDLDAYITQKAIDGLFYLVEIEENKIRKDPLARVSDILVKVFGSLF